MATAVNGLVLVPLIPTPAMIAAGLAEQCAAGVWSAMIAAAPTGTNGSVVGSLRAMRRDLSSPSGCDLPPAMLTALPPTRKTRRNPDFWSDLEVRRLVVGMHRQMTIAQALVAIAEQVGPERTPSKSALARVWKRLDLTPKTHSKEGA